ncbi:MAG TPA: LPD38 domain-containing protein [Patescibacteria group bacterium]|nr:LPD38 domain-containing protein [Patescibacteria group bacterium]
MAIILRNSNISKSEESRRRKEAQQREVEAINRQRAAEEKSVQPATEGFGDFRSVERQIKPKPVLTKPIEPQPLIKPDIVPASSNSVGFGDFRQSERQAPSVYDIPISELMNKKVDLSQLPGKQQPTRPIQFTESDIKNPALYTLAKALQGGMQTGYGILGAQEALKDTVQDIASRVTGIKPQPVNNQFKLYPDANDLMKTTEEYNQNLAKAEDQYASGGQKLYGNIVSGTTAMIPTLAMSAVNPAAGLASTGITAGGAGARQAKNEGANPYQALAYGALTGAKEAATEKLFGLNMPFMKGSLDNVIEGAIKGGIKSQAGQALTKYVTGMVGEGSEEVISSLVEPWLQKMTYNPNAKVDYSGLLNDFLVGAGVSGVLGAPGTVIDVANSRQQSTPTVNAQPTIQRPTEQQPTPQQPIIKSPVQNVQPTKQQSTVGIVGKSTPVNAESRINKAIENQQRVIEDLQNQNLTYGIDVTQRMDLANRNLSRLNNLLQQEQKRKEQAKVDMQNRIKESEEYNRFVNGGLPNVIENTNVNVQNKPIPQVNIKPTEQFEPSKPVTVLPSTKSQAQDKIITSDDTMIPSRITNQGGLITVEKSDNPLFYTKNNSNNEIELYPDKIISDVRMEPQFTEWFDISRNDNSDKVSVVSPAILKYNPATRQYEFINKGKIAIGENTNTKPTQQIKLSEQTNILPVTENQAEGQINASETINVQMQQPIPQQPTKIQQPPMINAKTEQPRKIKNYKSIANPIQRISEFSSDVSKGELVDVDTVVQESNYVMDNEEPIKSELSKLKVAELSKMIPVMQRSYLTKKDEFVNKIYDNMLSRLYYNASGENSITYGFGSGSYSDVVRNKIKTSLTELTPEKLNNILSNNNAEYSEMQNRKTSYFEGLKNPKTLEDFQNKKRVLKLTQEEQDVYENLLADRNKKEREAKSVKDKERKAEKASQVVGDTDKYNIEKSTHSKTGEDVWVVTLNDRIDKDEWTSINSAMKSLGGNYWRGNKGWNFKVDPTDKLQGNIKTQLEEKQELTKEKRVEKLRQVAENMQDTIDDKFSDRLVNTARRARMAASAEADGEYLQRIQQTLHNIADAIESGEVKLLDNIDSKAQVETLEHTLSTAKYTRIQAEQKKMREEKINDYTISEYYQEQKSKPYSNDDIRHASLPLTEINVDTLKRFIQEIKGKKGFVLIANRLSKLVTKADKDGYVDVTEYIDEIEKIIKNSNDVASYWESTLAERKRLARMGIESDEELRAYLREYLQYRAGKRQKTSDEIVKEKQRQLIGRKIEGYFPTPAKVINKMLEYADIKESDTVLEPSAGQGHIVDEVRKVSQNIDVAEFDPSNREILEIKKYNVVGNDALSIDKQYNKIVMNPPFEKNQDIKHVRYAYDNNLKSGGRLVAIMSEHPFFANDKESIAFREWLESVGGTSEKLPEGSFKESDRSTGVNTRLVVIDKQTQQAESTEQATEQTNQTIPIDDRNFDNVGSRKVTAIQHENPELKPYIQTEAKRLLTELKNTIKGEKTIGENEQGETTYQGGVKRQTSKSIERILELESKPSYAEIEDSLNRLLHNQGQENIALAKRIELVIDDNLSEGTVSLEGVEIKPNNEYVSLKGKTAEEPTLTDDDLPVIDNFVKPRTQSKGSVAFKGLSEWKQARKEGKIDQIERPSDIIKEIEKFLKVPISKGKVTKRNALGIFKVHPETVRIKLTNDLPVVSHEVGHYLDKQFKLQKASNINEVIGLLPDDFASLYKDSEIPGEAVAEFVRMYLLDKDNAQQQAPMFYYEFINALDSQTLKFIDIAANSIQSYMSASNIEKSKSFIKSRTETNKNNSVSDMFDKIYTRVFDDLNPIQLFAKAVEMKKDNKLTGANNPYIMALNSRGSDIIANTIATERFIDSKGNVIGKSLKEILEPIQNKKYKDFTNYLVNKHAVEWLTPDENGNTKRVFADNTLNNLESVQESVKYYEENYPEFIAVANELYEYQNNLLDKWLVETGLLPKDVADTLKEKYKYYVPFYRDIEGQGSKAKSSFANQTDQIKSAKGSGADILDPVESIIVNTERFVNAAKRNEVMQIIDRHYKSTDGLGYFLERVPPNMMPQRTDMTQLKAKLSKAAEEAGIENIDELIDDVINDTLLTFRPDMSGRKDMVTVFVNGEKKMYQVHDKEFLNAITALSPQTANWVVNSVGQLTRVMKNLTTGINPIFGVARNVWKDIPTTFIYKRSKGFNYLVHIGDIMKAFVDVMRNTEAYKEYHAAGGGHSSSISANRNLLNETLNEIVPGRKTSNVLRTGEYLLSLVEQFNNAIESAPRFAEYKKTGGNTGAYSDKMQAIFESQDISVNFKRHGKWTKDADAFIPYLNAAMQGLDKLGRTAKESPGKFIIKMFISTVLPTIVLYAINNDDEDYENLSSYMKDNHFNIKLNNGKFWRIPKPRELGVIASGTERILEYWKTDDPDAFYGFIDYIKTNFLPPLPIPFIQHGRTIFAPLNDLRANKNFADIPIVPRELEKLPNEYQYDNKTSAIAKGLGSAFDMSPKQIDYIIDSYTGIIGKLNRSLTADKKDFAVGIGNTITADPNYSTDVFNKFYDEIDKMEKMKQESKINKKLVEGFNPGKLKAYNQVADVLSDMRNNIKAIEKGKLSDAKKKEHTDRIRKQMIEVTKKALQK